MRVFPASPPALAVCVERPHTHTNTHRKTKKTINLSLQTARSTSSSNLMWPPQTSDHLGLPPLKVPRLPLFVCVRAHMRQQNATLEIKFSAILGDLPLSLRLAGCFGPEASTEAVARFCPVYLSSVFLRYNLLNTFC